MVIDSLGRGGKERQFIELLKHLKLHDEMQVFIVLRRKNVEYPELFHLGYEIYYPPSPSKLKFIFFLNKVMDDTKPDIIHSWERFVTSNCIVLGMLKRKKVINFDIQYAFKIRIFSLQYLHEKINQTLASRNIANSYAGLKIFHLKASKKNRVIYNGFDQNRIDDAEKTDIREKLNLKNSSLICMTANFTHPKDYKTLVEAGTRILVKRRDVFFIFIGEGPERSAIQDLVPKEFIEHFLFLGRRADVENIVKEIEIGILLSKSGHAEGFSNSIMEYMAAGKPVIATNVGGTPELILDGVTGYLIPHQDIDGLQEKIEFLLDNPDIKTKMGSKGRERITKEFGLEKMADQFICLYNELQKKNQS